jgi:hypothetical protein
LTPARVERDEAEELHAERSQVCKHDPTWKF